MFLVTSKQMFQAETNAVKRGYTFPLLMENAGRACAEIVEKYCSSKSNVLVVCGKGKNGGDGFVIARRLFEHGLNVKIMLACGEPKAEDAVANYRLCEKLDIDFFEYKTDISQVSQFIENADIIIDAVFGTGFSGELDSRLSTLARAVNSSKAKIIAVDVPSGADCDKASVSGEAIKADLTIAISAYKPIHIIKPHNSVCGDLVIADIGIIDEDFKSGNGKYNYTLSAEDIKKILPERMPVSNKGTYGNAFCICSSKNMVGAGYFSIEGALRMGAGLVTAVFPECVYPVLVPKINEPVLLPLGSNEEGTFSAKCLPKLIEVVDKKANAVLVGCGLGLNEDTKALVSWLIKSTKAPLVIDADGINAISDNIDILKEAKATVVLTPHPGEMSRICKKSIAEILQDPISVAKEFAEEYGVTLVLKGANTVVCGSGEGVYVNCTGNSGLARGGSGDLLAGMLVSLLAQGMTAENAAVCAVYLHGLAADRVAKATSQRGMLPTDVLEHLPKLLSNFE